MKRISDYEMDRLPLTVTLYTLIIPMTHPDSFMFAHSYSKLSRTCWWVNAMPCKKFYPSTKPRNVKPRGGILASQKYPFCRPHFFASASSKWHKKLHFVIFVIEKKSKFRTALDSGAFGARPVPILPLRGWFERWSVSKSVKCKYFVLVQYVTMNYALQH